MDLLFAQLVVILALTAPPSATQPGDEEARHRLPPDALAEARASFTFQGRPIHPGLVKEFIGWLSDAGPITASVDVAAAAGTDEYWDREVERQGDWLRINTDEGRGYFLYQRLGGLEDGTQVLLAADNGGGSGVWHYALLVRFHTDWARRHDGALYERLLMTVVAERGLGDRPQPMPEIEVRHNEVVIRSAEGGKAYSLRPPPTAMTQPSDSGA